LISSGVVKYKNLVREPWAALHVAREDFGAYVVIEADVELSAIAHETSWWALRDSNPRPAECKSAALAN
jgi:hypothetical protein